MIWVIMLALCIHAAPIITSLILALVIGVLMQALYWTFEMRRA